MNQVVRVEFSGPARSQYCSAGGVALALGDFVVVETEWGVGMGAVAAVLPPLWLATQDTNMSHQLASR